MKLRGGAAAARSPHKRKVAGSSPAPATSLSEFRLWAIWIFATILSGCTLIAPSNESRVTEYRVGGVYGLLSGDGQGVRVVGEGVIDGCLEYRTENSSYRSPGCEAEK